MYDWLVKYNVLFAVVYFPSFNLRSHKNKLYIVQKHVDKCPETQFAVKTTLEEIVKIGL